jgi:carnitine monooxygenase subunit
MYNLETDWRDMQRRILDQLENDKLPDFAEAIMEVSPEIYTDSQRFSLECNEVFRRQPLLAGLSSDVSAAGDYLEMDVAGAPVLVIRGSDGELRAFLNVCAHRGATPQRGSSGKWVCPYHGWVYADDGSLHSTPLAEAFTNMDRQAKGLTRLPVAEWQGMVFVRATPEGEAIDVESYLDDLAPILAALQLQNLKRNARDRLEVRSNWKLALDTGREIYHVPVVHRNTLAKNLYNHTMISDQYGLHNRYCGAGKDFQALVGAAEEDWPDMPYQAVHYIYPNTTLAISHAVDGQTPMVSISQVFPGENVGNAHTYLSTYSLDRDEASTEIHKAVVALVETEDYAQSEQIWKNLAAGAGPVKLVWGRNEALLQQYQRQIADQIGMPI